MTLVKFGENTIKSLWKRNPEEDGWEGYSYVCPKCSFEVLMNEEVEPCYNYCPMCGKKMWTDSVKDKQRKKKKTEYMREYQSNRRKAMRGDV